MSLHPPSGWHVYRVKTYLSPAPMMVLVHDNGRHTSIFRNENPVLWTFLDSYADDCTLAQLAVTHTNLTLNPLLPV